MDKQQYKITVLPHCVRLQPTNSMEAIEVSAKNMRTLPENTWQTFAQQACKVEFRQFIGELTEIEYQHFVAASRKYDRQQYNDVRAITIHAPHAYAIIFGIKEQEYRNRDTKQRGWILIHCGQSKESDRFFDNYGIDPEGLPRGCIIGAAYLYNVGKVGRDFEYQLKNPIIFDKIKPLYISGKQPVFWSPSDAGEKKVFEQAIGLLP